MAEPRRGWIQPGISVGNVLVLISMFVSVAVGWARLESGLAEHNRRIQELEAADKSLVSERMREARDMADVRADMRWIRSTLERLERDLKGRK